MDKTYEKRKKVVYDLICDELYVPMKFKELAMLLQAAKEQRDELREILEALGGDKKANEETARQQGAPWRGRGLLPCGPLVAPSDLIPPL